MMDVRTSDVANLLDVLLDELEDEFHDLEHGADKKRNLVDKAYWQGKAVQTAYIITKIRKVRSII